MIWKHRKALLPPIVATELRKRHVLVFSKVNHQIKTREVKARADCITAMEQSEAIARGNINKISTSWRLA